MVGWTSRFGVVLDPPVLPGVAALGPDAAQVIYSNRNKDYSQQGWTPMIGAFFNRGLMLMDFEEHMFHRRIMQEAFVRTRLVGYTEQVDKVVSQVVANDWVTNDPRFLMYPAMKELTLDIASMVFMGHEPGTDHELVTKVNNAFTTTTRAAGNCAPSSRMACTMRMVGSSNSTPTVTLARIPATYRPSSTCWS